MTNILYSYRNTSDWNTVTEKNPTNKKPKLEFKGIVQRKHKCVLQNVLSASDKLTGHKKFCVSLSLSSRAASEALEDSSVSWLHPPHRQPRGCTDLVTRVGQFGEWHRVLIPLNPGLWHAYMCAWWETKTKNNFFFVSLITSQLTSLLRLQLPLKQPHTLFCHLLFSLLSNLAL